MIGIELSLSADEKRKFDNLASESAQWLKKSSVRAVSALRSQLRSVIRSGGGKYGVPKFPPLSFISEALRPGQKMFGILAENQYVRMYKLDGRQMVGWIPRMAEWAGKLQEGEERVMEEHEVKHIVRWGKLRISEGFKYSRPSRDVITPFALHAQANYPEYVLKNFEKIKNKAIAK